MTVLVNGVPADTLPVFDRGLSYGDGLFETIAVVNGKPLLWERHMQRLQAGCRILHLGLPNTEQLLAEVEQVSTRSARAAVKIIVTRGSGGRGYRAGESAPPSRIVMALNWPDPPAGAEQNGVAVRWCQMRISRQPALAGIKHLNRLEQVLARAEWQDEYAEGLLCDSDGNVIEGTKSNLFLVTAGTLHTPDLSESGVAGVVRAEILEAAVRLGIPAKVASIRESGVESADELFLTNSLIGIWPIARLESKSYVVGKITQTLQKTLRNTG